MSFEEFCVKFKTQNFKQYVDDYFVLNRKKCIGCHYYMTVSTDLDIINTSTKKDKDKKKLKTFVSTSSALDVKYKTFRFILVTAFENGLLDECLCSKELIEKQKEWLEIAL